MGRIIGIDYGKKRTGLAWTDPLRIIASGIGSFDTQQLKAKMKELFGNEELVGIVLGYPTKFDGTDTHSTAGVRELEKALKKWFPGIPVFLWDERLTSKMAMKVMIEGGVKKKKRRDKQLVNEIAATLILQEFMESSTYQKHFA